MVPHTPKYILLLKSKINASIVHIQNVFWFVVYISNNAETPLPKISNSEPLNSKLINLVPQFSSNSSLTKGQVFNEVLSPV